MKNTRVSVVNKNFIIRKEKKNIHGFYSLFVNLLVSAPNVAPSDVGGGGGTNRELTITWAVSINELHGGDALTIFNCRATCLLK